MEGLEGKGERYGTNLRGHTNTNLYSAKFVDKTRQRRFGMSLAMCWHGMGRVKGVRVMKSGGSEWGW